MVPWESQEDQVLRGTWLETAWVADQALWADHNSSMADRMAYSVAKHPNQVSGQVAAYLVAMREEDDLNLRYSAMVDRSSPSIGLERRTQLDPEGHPRAVIAALAMLYDCWVMVGQ